MNNIQKTFLLTIILALTSLLSIDTATAATPETKDGVTRIHLDQYGGYFDAKETLASLKAGTYEIVVTNKTNKLVGFQIQNNKTHEQLDMFPLEPNQTRISKVEITTDGFRFRCPINPTPWYEMDGIK